MGNVRAPRTQAEDTAAHPKRGPTQGDLTAGCLRGTSSSGEHQHQATGFKDTVATLAHRAAIHPSWCDGVGGRFGAG